MKEPNDPNQETWDFRDWWKDVIKYGFSYRIAEWSYGILNRFPEYDKVWRMKNTALNAIQNVAFMNIKKTGGKGNSDCEILIQHLNTNFDFIHRQIEIIAPDIIITGTSWNELRDALFPKIIWQPSGYEIVISKHNNAKVIDFYHPSSRTAPAASYSLLQNIISSVSFKVL